MKDTGFRKICSTGSSTASPPSPQSVVLGHHTSVSNACRNSIFCSHLCQLCRGQGKKGPFQKEKLPRPPEKNPSLRSHLSSEEKIPQTLIHFTEAHIGYRELGVVLAWPVPGSILSTAPLQLWQVENDTHCLNHCSQTESHVL